jgi:hypothetical protein
VGVWIGNADYSQMIHTTVSAEPLPLGLNFSAPRRLPLLTINRLILSDRQELLTDRSVRFPEPIRPDFAFRKK